MPVDVREFFAYPGRRFPVHTILRGKARDDDLRTVEEITLDGEGFAQLGTLYLELTIRARISQPCCRCLAPVTTSIEQRESLEVPVPPGAESVNLWSDLLNLVLAAHNPNVLCRRDCRGLCPACGANLNDEPDHVCQSSANERRTLQDFLT
jgi:uncharacterized protein